MRVVQVALPAASGSQIVFEVGIAVDGREWRERSASEVGVKYDARGIDYPLQRGLAEALQGAADGVFEGGRLLAGADGLARSIKRLADLFDDQGMRKSAGRQCEPPEQLIDGRKGGKVH